jgi:hypothetical protein
MLRKPIEEDASSLRVLWFDIGISCLLFVAALAYFSLTFTRTFELRDEGFILFEGARTAAGEIPHRDFIDVYGPAVFAVNGLTLWLFDGKILPLRIVLALVKAGAVVLTFLISRLLATRAFAVFGALLAVAYWGRLSWNLNTPYAALYTIPLCMLAVFVLIIALLRGSTRGYFGAGLIAGTAILFKQSLGIFNAYGMLLAVCAVGMLDEEPTKKSLSVASVALALWFLAAIALVMPFVSIMGLRDYLLHFLPFHLLMALVAAAVLVRGGFGSPVSTFKNRLCPLALGLAVMPAITACVYRYWGSLDVLVFNMFVFPRTYANYYIAAPVPPLSLSLFMIGALALVSSILLIVRGRRASAVVLGTLASALIVVARYVVPVGQLETVHVGYVASRYVEGLRLYDLGTLWRVWDFLDGVQSPAISVIALAVFASSFLRSAEPRRSRVIRVVIPLVLFQTLMCFQVFPRATYNLWQTQGALMPLLTIVLFRWYRLGAPAGASLHRRASAALITALLPLWMLAPVVQRVVLPDEESAPRRTLNLPATSGITLSEFDVKWNHIDEFEKLVTFLRTRTPTDAPIFLLTNEPMILFLSQRETLFPERAFYLSLLGWEMLPEAQREGLDVDAMIERLENTPETILISRAELPSLRFLTLLPGLHDFVLRKYEVMTRIGSYLLLRQKERQADPSDAKALTPDQPTRESVDQVSQGP